MDAFSIQEHRKAWLEHYAARMASGKPYPTCEGYTDTADRFAGDSADVYKIEEKLRKRVKNTKPMIDSDNGEH